MKKKLGKKILIGVCVAFALVAAIQLYKSIVSGNQRITISTSSKNYTNSEIYVTVTAKNEKSLDLETKTKLKLLDSSGKAVKHVKVNNENDHLTISVPDIEPGNYFIEAKVSSKAGKDTVRKPIYLAKGNQENITITMDKGIYKPGDLVNFRALITSKDDDSPISENVELMIYDGNDNKVYDETTQTSDYGIISGCFTLANEVNSGIYKLVVKSDATEASKQWKVNPYVTPKYEINVEFDKNNYLVGDTATINLSANYFFGEAASETKYIVYLNDVKFQEITADQNGKATIHYEIKEAKKYQIKVEAVDSSNYYVENTANFSAGTDLFEIKFIPEYGDLIENHQNQVYVYTTKADGSPVKTYLTITSERYTKQVATDENGMGCFTIDIDANFTSSDLNNQSKQQSFAVKAQDMEGNEIKKNLTLNVKNKNAFLSTNKVKYHQGEDIELELYSMQDLTKDVYFVKNNKTIKTIHTDQEKTTVNLGDTYGLIDIYIMNQANKSSYYYTKNQINQVFKRTIFIKPEKQLNIEILTDKSEYKPGEKMTLSFHTTDQTKNSIEAALLVSMLDNSVLSLADNDLSIDNIKLALSDIQFSDEMDAATLYACIVEDKSEQTLTALLLKQGNQSLQISETTFQNNDVKEHAKKIAIILIVALYMLILSVVLIKHKWFKKFIQLATNLIIYYMIVFSSLLYLIDHFESIYLIESTILFMIAVAVICIATYAVWISKIEKKISRTSLTLLWMFLIGSAYIVFSNLFEYYNISSLWVIIPLIAATLSFIVWFIVAKEDKKTKIKQKFLTEGIYFCKMIGAATISIIIGMIIQLPTVTIIIFYILNYFFNLKGKNNDQVEDTIGTKKITFYCVIVFAMIGLFALAIGVVYVIRSTYTINNAYISDFPSPTSSEIRTGIRVPEAISVDADYSHPFKGGSFDINNILTNGKSFMSSKNQSESEAQRASTQEQEKEEVRTIEKTADTDTKIRNVFLESMCFVPELITSNGNANLDLTLSDNITTWTIQTIGNTKDGKIGYQAVNDIKVWKEFFVDFELPKNLIQGDEVSIPLTVYNYTENQLTANIKINREDWFEIIESDNFTIDVEAKASKMVYVPIRITKFGEFNFRIEANNTDVSDIVEKNIAISPKGTKVEKVVSTGTLEGTISEDILCLDEMINQTGKVKVKIYASPIAQTIEGMENIFRMPTGCFEQISSSLYPNILALQYMEDTGKVEESIKTRALNYISSGYQKLLTYEVKGESGGYSLYGSSPAETVLTAYGLMELTDLKEVYKVDENVLNKMNQFLYKKQNLDGSFEITGYHLGGANSNDKLALNAYIVWALSESNSKEEKLKKSIDYLKGKLDQISDNYTLALIANALANVKDKESDKVIKRLVNNVTIDGNYAYLTSNVTDYYGSRYKAQNLQTVALTSMALSKLSKNTSLNKQLINYIIQNKDPYGTWRSTQATILCLKALNALNEKQKIENQDITVKLNATEQTIQVKENALDIYEVKFTEIEKENKLSINLKKGSAYYEVIEEYYTPYEKAKSDNKIEIKVDANTHVTVNEIINAKIQVMNFAENSIYNGMVTVSIPQGCAVREESLMEMQSNGLIEKYEMTYSTVNIYLRNFERNQIVDLDIQFRASYPVNVTGLSVRAYDYYNPEIEGIANPIEIKVTQ